MQNEKIIKIIDSAIVERQDIINLLERKIDDINSAKHFLVYPTLNDIFDYNHNDVSLLNSMFYSYQEFKIGYNKSLLLITDFVYDINSKLNYGRHKSNMISILIMDCLSKISNKDSFKALENIDKEAFMKTIELFDVYKNIRMAYTASSTLYKSKYDRDIDKEYKIMFTKLLSNHDISLDKFFADLKEIHEGLDDLLNSSKSMLNDNRKIIAYLDKLKRKMNNINSITKEDIDIIASSSITSNKKELILGFIYDYLKEENNKLMDAHDELLNNTDASKIAKLTDYNIDLSYFDKTTALSILDLSYSELCNKLEFIRKYNISNTDIISYILLNTNDTILNQINDLINDDIIGISYLNKNNSIYVFKNTKEVLEKVKYLIDKKINYKLFVSNPCIYEISFDLFKNNIDYLYNLKLTNYFKNANNLDFITSYDLIHKLDLFIDLGYISILENNLDLLNYDFNVLKRLCLLNILDYNVESNINDIFGKKKYLVNNDKIDEFIFDETLLIPEDIQELLSTNTNNVYDDVYLTIGNSIISNRRYKDNLSKLENSNYSLELKMFYAAIYGANYTYDKISLIANALNIDIFSSKKSL